jgi:exosortase/archaeosortase family protein
MKPRKPFYLFTNNLKLQKLKFLQDVFLFAVIIYGFHLLWWKGGLDHFLSRYTSFAELQEFIAHQVYLPASWLVNHVAGYAIQTGHNTLYFSNGAYVAVEKSCSGLKQMYEWLALMILFPGPWKRKLWYIPVGIVVIHLENILRIFILSVVAVNWPAHWDLIHMWIMRPFYYVVIFLLWLIWVERIKDKKQKYKDKSI